MDAVLGVIESPIFLAMLVFFGIASLVTVLLGRNPALKRSQSSDRRMNRMPQLPFYDDAGVLVSADRRTKLDRRRARLLALQHELGEERQMDGAIN